MIPNTLEGELLRRKLRKDYAAYCQYVNPGFYMTTFHRFLCNEIQEFLEHPCTNGAMDILLLSVPPQHGKSFTVTKTLPSWCLGRDPASGVIIAGYESSFAENFNRRNRDKFNEYCTDIFKDAAPNKSVQSTGRWETSKGGACRAAGLKAGVTGYPADLFIMDDPIKNKEAATSAAIIGKIHDEMGPSVQSRIHPGGKLIVIQTRWVENDVIGWILANWGEWVYKYINLPCEYDEEAARLGPDPLGRSIGDSLIGAQVGDDESLIPAKIANTNRWLVSKKRLVINADGERTWNALYQGRPSAEKGNLYHEDWWQFYDRTEQLRSSLDYLQLSVDATFKNTDVSDFVAMELWGLKGVDVYLWRLVNKRMAFVETVQYIKRICKDYPDISELVIEDKANGSAIIDVLAYENDIPPIVAVQPKGGKYARAQATSNFVSTRKVHLPRQWTSEEEASIENYGDRDATNGTNLFIRQHTTFPYAAHDDMVDAQSQGLSRILKLVTGEVPMPKRKYERYTNWQPDMWEDYEQLSDVEQLEYVRIYGAPVEWSDEYNN